MHASQRKQSLAEEEERSRAGHGYDPGAEYKEGPEEAGEVAEGATGSDAAADAVYEDHEEGIGEPVVSQCGPAGSVQAHASPQPCASPQEFAMVTPCPFQYTPCDKLK